MKLHEKEYVVTFNSTHHALSFEKHAKEHDIKITIMPVPRSIAASCGLAIKFSQCFFERIENLIKEKNLNYESIYRIDDKDGRKDYVKI